MLVPTFIYLYIMKAIFSFDVDDFTSFKHIMITHIDNVIKGGSTAIIVVDELSNILSLRVDT